jgi:hypothetical protein
MKDHKYLSNCIDALCKTLVKDEGYRLSWKANIAMAFKDEWASAQMQYSARASNEHCFLSIEEVLNFISNIYSVTVLTGSKPVGEKD